VTGKEAKLTLVNVIIIIKTNISFFIKQRNKKRNIMPSIIKKVGVAGFEPYTKNYKPNVIP
ncbi:MAG: hypothetical protein P8H17_01690, partial [Flavobacteriales bacterium]|nr:hypothetical protein [Flavobacteriales bacterium]